MIVLIYTKDGFWLAADSYRSKGEKHFSDVCKIHETRFGLLVKSGESQGETATGQVYSTDKEVEDLLATAKDLKDFQSLLRLQFKADIDEELAILVDDPDVNGQNLEEIKMRFPIPEELIPILTRTVIMFDTKTSDSVGKILLIEPQSDQKNDGLGRTYYKYWAPSVFGWHPANDAIEQALPPGPPFKFPSSVREFTYLLSYLKTEDWVENHPQKAIREILQQANREQPETIGPPYTIVHVISKKLKPSKIKWISKGVCPGWSESISTEDTLIQLRDELRKQKLMNH